MIEQRSGRIINIVMTAVDRGAPGMAHSGAARAGVVNLTKSFAVEWARHNITVNALAPGIFITHGAQDEMKVGRDDPSMDWMVDLVPLKRLGKPAEFAEIVAFLPRQQPAT